MSADFTPEKEDLKILTPFKMQVLTNFPYIEADFDALTNYQLLCKIVEYLNAVIHNENEVTEQVTGLYNAYVSLQSYVNNYFDNLDVQEEINKKLDEMAEDGTLADIIADYIQLKGQLVYNTVEEMKEATNLYNGSFAKTYGYYSYNDGGGALYKVRTVTNSDTEDNMLIIPLSDESLVAELIVENNTINLKQLGAKGDYTDNIANIITTALTKCNNIFIPAGTYKLNNFNTDKQCHIYGDGAYKTILKTDDEINYVLTFDYSSSHDWTINDLNIHDLQIYGNNRIHLIHSQESSISNIFFTNIDKNGVSLFLDDNCHSCVIEKNSFRYSEYAIIFDGSNNNIIKGNSISYNTHPFEIKNTSNGNYLIYNDIEGYNGYSIIAGNYNFISNNRFERNTRSTDYGWIYITGNGNSIFDNTAHSVGGTENYLPLFNVNGENNIISLKYGSGYKLLNNNGHNKFIIRDINMIETFSLIGEASGYSNTLSKSTEIKTDIQNETIFDLETDDLTTIMTLTNGTYDSDTHQIVAGNDFSLRFNTETLFANYPNIKNATILIFGRHTTGAIPTFKYIKNETDPNNITGFTNNLERKSIVCYKELKDIYISNTLTNGSAFYIDKFIITANYGNDKIYEELIDLL